MAKKRPRPEQPRPEPEQLVFPFQLRVGDVVLEDGERLEVVDRPTGSNQGKLTRVVVRRPPTGVRQETFWEVWRKLRVQRRSA